MEEKAILTNKRLTTPRSAAIAGVVFSVLLISSIVLIRISVPNNPRETGLMPSSSWRTIRLALNLLPLAGIAFLWFIGVIRDRLGAYEDRFFATVFLGSGLLFLAMLFASAAVAGGIIAVYGGAPPDAISTATYTFARALTYAILTVYTVKMAGVFMISTCTIALRTGIMPRWMVFVGYGLALFLVFSLEFIEWSILVFPGWVLLISLYFLIENYRESARVATIAPMDENR